MAINRLSRKAYLVRLNSNKLDDLILACNTFIDQAGTVHSVEADSLIIGVQQGKVSQKSR